MSTSSWRWFPHALIVSMAAVFAVNFYMAYAALQTFPGQAGQDGFDLSNEYQRVLATARQQAALGWRIEADVSGTRYPVLRLSDRSGAPLAAVVDARAERPVGPLEATVLAFRAAEPGRFEVDKPLRPGQWDIMLTVRSDGRLYSTTRRVIVQ